MANLRNLLFRKYATISKNKLLAELKARYTPKKGDRFKVAEITYEIGDIIINGQGMEFEISSKIPKEELPPEMDLDAYVERVKEIIVASGKAPLSINRSNIVHTLGEIQIKKRDYIRVRYGYQFSELYDEQQILQEATAIAKGEKKLELPDIPSVTTTSAKLILLHLRDNLYNHLKEKVELLVSANNQVKTNLN